MSALTNRKKFKHIRHFVISLFLLCAFALPVFGQWMDVKIIQSQINTTGVSGFVPGYISNIGNTVIGAPARSVSYNVTGATYSLLLPDNRVVVVNCAGKYSLKFDYVNMRSCRMPVVENIQAEFKRDKAKLVWPVSLNGRAWESETYKILGIFDYVPDVDTPYKDGKIEENSNAYNESRQDYKCTYNINGFCTTEDIGGVEVSRVNIASSLSEIDRQIAVLNAFLAAPIDTPDYSGIEGFMTPKQVQQGYQNYMQMEQLNRQRYQILLQELQQARTRQVNQQVANETYRLKFENYNNFTVNVLFEAQESGAKRTGTIVLNAKEAKETTDTFIDPKNVVLITRRLGN